MYPIKRHRYPVKHYLIPVFAAKRPAVTLRILLRIPTRLSYSGYIHPEKITYYLFIGYANSSAFNVPNTFWIKIKNQTFLVWFKIQGQLYELHHLVIIIHPLLSFQRFV